MNDNIITWPINNNITNINIVIIMTLSEFIDIYI